MGELQMTALLLAAVAGFAWLICRVLGTADAGGESPARADTNAVGALPGSEQIEDAVSRARAHVVPGGSAV